jgi:transposase
MAKVLFKQSHEGEILLFPERLDATISDTHLVRVINDTVNRLDITSLLSGYKGGGTTSYHPRMLLKVLLYAYCLKIYTGRKIANALRSDITFMWLSGKQYPDFRTINNFRSGRLKDDIHTVFKSLLLLMMEEGYIHFKEYYCDGTTIQADANKHKVVWKKNSARYIKSVEERIEATLLEVDRLVEEENGRYGDEDLEIVGKADPCRKDRIQESISRLNAVINREGNAGSKKSRSASRLKNELEESDLRRRIYEDQERICGERSGYSRTDPEATPMRTKECVDDVRPAYNGIVGSEGQYITGVSTHQNPNDGACFKEHLEQAVSLMPKNPDRVIADAIFGTEENYEFLDTEKVESLLKYPSYDKEQTKEFKENIFHKDNMPYDPEDDSFLCPNNKRLFYTEDTEQANKNGFVSTSRNYQCEDCVGCPFFDRCGSKRQEGSNRIIKVNVRLEEHRRKTRLKLQTEEGKTLMKNRGHDIETCFGDIKQNMLFRRVHLRGLEKVHAECIIIAIAHNIRKMQIAVESKAA